MKFVYLILAHKNLKQLKLLINQLDYSNNKLIFHIDKKSNLDLEEIKRGATKCEIIFVNERIDVRWGNYTQIDATLSLFKTLKESKEKFDYIHLISGQDFPLKSNEKINEFFKESHYQYFSLENIGDETKEIDFRWDIYHLLERRHKYKIIRGLSRLLLSIQLRIGIKRTFPKPFIKVKGSQWFSITQDCFDYIYDFIKENKEFCNFFKYTFCPDESLIQTIVYNSKYRNSIINDNKRYIDWEIGPYLPTIFKEEHLDMLIESNKLLARKFDLNYDEKIIFKLKERISV